GGSSGSGRRSDSDRGGDCGRDGNRHSYRESSRGNSGGGSGGGCCCGSNGEGGSFRARERRRGRRARSGEGRDLQGGGRCGQGGGHRLQAPAREVRLVQRDRGPRRPGHRACQPQL
ncbi:unnamed protein product, partial [Laminaria digitata]